MSAWYAFLRWLGYPTPEPEPFSIERLTELQREHNAALAQVLTFGARPWNALGSILAGEARYAAGVWGDFTWSDV